MKKNYSLIGFLFFSLLIFVSCSDTSPEIVTIYKTLVYEFSDESSPCSQRLSVFIVPSSDVKRSKSIEVKCSVTNYKWKIDKPEIYTSNKKTYFGHSNLIAPKNKTFEAGEYFVDYYDMADRLTSEKFILKTIPELNVSVNENQVEEFLTSEDVRNGNAGYECSQKRIAIFDEVKRELFWGYYSPLLSDNKKILELYPDAVYKRMYYCNPDSSIVILMPEEKIENQ